MSDILLLIYLGDVANSLSALLVICGLITAFSSLVIASVIEGWTSKSTIAVVCGVAMLLTAAMIPSKQFFYIAAGGSAAVKALDSDIGKKVQDLVNKKLDEAIGEGKK